jgi:hypothetical protein
MQLAKEQAESASSSQASATNVPWDKPFVRVLNTVKNKSPLRRPHMGRVVGAGQGRKHVYYGLAENKEARQERKSRETENLREELADLKESMPRLVDDTVANRVNELLPSVMQSISAYFAGGQKGPLPMISLGGSNSHNVAPPAGSARPPPAGSAPRENAPVILVTPAASNAGGREDSPAVPPSSPSVTCTPAPGPSTLAELDALTVIN